MDKITKLDRMNQLIAIITKANADYYEKSNPTLTDKKYDSFYDELLQLEQETNTIFSNSPTQKVGGEIIEGLSKVKHNKPMLSLDKTKDIKVLKRFLGDKIGVLSYKLDGLTVILQYKNGKLFKAITRGTGEIGEDITHNAKMFKNIPLTISYLKDLEIRGEAVITFEDFEIINEKRTEEGLDLYKNPRNLASGSVRQLDSNISKSRNVLFIAFDLINTEDFNLRSKTSYLDILKGQGFDIVSYVTIGTSALEYGIEILKPEFINIPTDGLVLEFDDVEYGKSLGATGHHNNNAMAFKWKDDAYETTYLYTEVETSRTGLSTPTVVFEPVEIDGTMVGRASCHNVSIWEKFKFGQGDIITVHKANQIIPQVYENLTQSGTDRLPDFCNVCGEELSIYQPNDTKFLMCDNDVCEGKLLGRLEHFVSRDCMNIMGLSRETLEKLVEKNIITTFVDIFKLEDHKNTIINMDRFGKKSYDRLIKSINEARNVEIPAFIKSLGIPLVGKSTGKLIAKQFNNDIQKILTASYDELVSIDGIGEETAKSYVNYMTNPIATMLNVLLLEELNIAKPNVVSDTKLDNLIFVVTGSVYHFANRKELQSKIEELGGKVSGSVSAKTNYVIANEVSGSSKFAKANKLGVPIISENDFLEMIK